MAPFRGAAAEDSSTDGLIASKCVARCPVDGTHTRCTRKRIACCLQSGRAIVRIAIPLLDAILYKKVTDLTLLLSGRQAVIHPLTTYCILTPSGRNVLMMLTRAPVALSSQSDPVMIGLGIYSDIKSDTTG